MFNKRKGVWCKECGVYLDKEKAQIVESTIDIGLFKYDDTYLLYYCDRHKKPYDVQIFNGNSRYYKTFEVDENGKLIKT